MKFRDLYRIHTIMWYSDVRPMVKPYDVVPNWDLGFSLGGVSVLKI